MKQDIFDSVEGERLAVPVTKRDHSQGRPDAPVILVEYGDYECPACGAAYGALKVIQETMGPDLLFVFRNFPLSNIHPHAEHAAEAAEAADAQGQFWLMHDALYENQDALEDEDLAQYAADVHLDVGPFIAELEAGKYVSRVREDFKSGIRSGVNGTPTFFINEMRYDGSFDPETMLAVLARAAEAPRSAARPGPQQVRMEKRRPD